MLKVVALCGFRVCVCYLCACVLWWGSFLRTFVVVMSENSNSEIFENNCPRDRCLSCLATVEITPMYCTPVCRIQRRYLYPLQQHTFFPHAIYLLTPLVINSEVRECWRTLTNTVSYDLHSPPWYLPSTLGNCLAVFWSPFVVSKRAHQQQLHPIWRYWSTW